MDEVDDKVLSWPILCGIRVESCYGMSGAIHSVQINHREVKLMRAYLVTTLMA